MFEKIGKFEIKQLLGQGAMGEVYLGLDPTIGREVAIKTILPSMAQGVEALSRFEREAKAVGVLNHPNIVTIHEFGEDQGVLFIAMEYVRGHDLGEMLQAQSITRPEILEILAQVCDGLDYAHRNGIVHRDIKPSNVRVTRDGNRLHVKVMDFGVAYISNSDMTATGMVMGTVCYMAPEYIRTEKLDPRSDLFAVGVVLYEALSGRKPFVGYTTPTILYKIVHEPPDPIDFQPFDDISPATRSVLDRALAKDPDERFQTADALAKALRAAKDPTWQGEVEQVASPVRGGVKNPDSARPVEEPTQLTDATRAKTESPNKLVPKQSNRWMIPFGIALASGLVILGIFATKKTKAPETPPPHLLDVVPAPMPTSPAPPVPAPVAPLKITPPPTPAPPVVAIKKEEVESPKPVVYFERLNIQADVILDNRERLIVEGKPDDPMRKAITPISVGRHHLHYEVSRMVRYHADIEVKAGENYVRPTFRYDSLPDIFRHLTYKEGQDNTYSFTQSQVYLTYDTKGQPFQNNAKLVLNIKLSKDPQNSQVLMATVDWQITNNGKELNRGSIENSHIAGAPWTADKKILYTDEFLIYFLKYHIADSAIQVDLGGSFEKTI